MPLLAINLPDRAVEAIKGLVKAGKYQTFEGFLEVAAFNQLAMERGATPSAIISHGHRNIPRSSKEKEDVTRTRRGQDNGRDDLTISRRSARRLSRQVFILHDLPSEEQPDNAFEPFTLVTALKGPAPCELDGPTRERIFGQVNRLFPMKLACRWIATQTLGRSETTEWPLYALVCDTIGDDAAKVGSLLEKWDAAAGRKRDDQLATGLPRRGNSASRDRFLSQFLARLTRAGEIKPGAIFHYQLGRFLDCRLALTHQGVAFAQMKNPILDSHGEGVESLSQEEIEFLTRHVVDLIHGERDDMRIVLTAIADGQTTPAKLLQSVHGKLPHEWTKGMLLTHVSGLIARLTDLQLIRRRWQGRNVEYDLGDRHRVKGFLKS